MPALAVSSSASGNLVRYLCDTEPEDCLSCRRLRKNLRTKQNAVLSILKTVDIHELWEMVRICSIIKQSWQFLKILMKEKFHTLIQISSPFRRKNNIVRFLHHVPSGLNYTKTKLDISLPDFLENELKTHLPELPLFLFLLSHGFYKAAQVTIVF